MFCVSNSTTAYFYTYENIFIFFTGITSFNPHNNPMREVKSLFPFYGWENSVTEKLNTLYTGLKLCKLTLKFTKVIHLEAATQAGNFHLAFWQIPGLAHYLFLRMYKQKHNSKNKRPVPHYSISLILNYALKNRRKHTKHI